MREKNKLINYKNMFSKNKFAIGALAGATVAFLTPLAIQRYNEPNRAYEEFQAQRAHANALRDAQELGYQEAICTTDAEGLLILPPAPLEILAQHEPIYDVQASCPDTYRDEVANRRYQIYIQRGY